MKSLIFIIFGLLIGILLIGSGVYYLRKENGDKDFPLRLVMNK